MFTLYIFAVFFIVISNKGSSCAPSDNYHWNDYDGTISWTAVQAGKNISGINHYIGQVKIPGTEATVPVLIRPLVTEVQATVGVGPPITVTVTEGIKILCAKSQAEATSGFAWLKTDAGSLSVSLTEQYAVIGGFEGDGEYLAIGRIKYGNEVKLGWIRFYSLDDNNLYFADKEQTHIVRKYEVLVLTDPWAQ